MVAALGWAAAVAAVAALGALFSGGHSISTTASPLPHCTLTLSLLYSGTWQFAPGACDRFERYLTSRIVGQDLALRQISDAVCDHLAAPSPSKPLVLSIHGPPGVGKSLFHQEAARALYSTAPGPALDCPGVDCRGYRVLFGLDFSADDREAQHAALRASLTEHMASATQALLVIEEYDKLDCEMRGFFRHLLEGGSAAGNFSLSRSIVVLESNTGYTALHGMLEAAGGREAIPPERAQRELKDIVFERWRLQGCEEYTDTMKMVGLVDFFLPFFPLERPNVKELFERRLVEKIATEAPGLVDWDPSAVEFLVDKVDFEGKYPIEGGKEVGTLLTRHVSRPVREWARAGAEAKKAREKPQKGRLVVAEGQDRLEIVELEAFGEGSGGGGGGGTATA